MEEVSKFCTNCGAEIADDTLFCTNCGQKVSETTEVEQKDTTTEIKNTNTNFGQPQPNPIMTQNVPTAPNPPQAPQGNVANGNPGIGYPKPVSTGAFVGLEILYVIPFIGLIACIIIAASAKNDNIANHAKSKLILYLIGIVIGIVVIILCVYAYKSLGIGNMQEYFENQLNGVYPGGLMAYIKSIF